MCPVGAMVVNNLVSPITAGNRANFTIVTTSNYTATGVQVSLTVGLQTILSPAFSVIVFDCAQRVSFSSFNDVYKQMLSPALSMPGGAVTTDTTNC